MKNIKVQQGIDALWSWITSYKGTDLLKDTSRVNSKFDCYIESNITNPLSFTIFKLSDAGELIIDDVARLAESKAAFFLFVNHKSGWVFAVKNTLENQKKLVQKEPIQNYKIRIAK